MRRRGILFGLVALAVAMSATAPAGAQASLSDRLARLMLQGQNGDLQRRFGNMLVDDGRDLEIDPAAGVGEARQTLLRRAALYEKIKDFSRAESDLAAAVQLDPASADLYLARGYFYMRRSRFTDALGDFLLAMKFSPDAARGRFAAGRAQAALGNYAAALGYYDGAIKLARRDPTYYLARAEAYIHLDQPRNAWADFSKAPITPFAASPLRPGRTPARRDPTCPARRRPRRCSAETPSAQRSDRARRAPHRRAG